jgi:hypothetical protein
MDSPQRPALIQIVITVINPFNSFELVIQTALRHMPWHPAPESRLRRVRRKSCTVKYSTVNFFSRKIFSGGKTPRNKNAPSMRGGL